MKILLRVTAAVVGIVLLFALAADLPAQERKAQPACEDVDGFHELDFWVGEWDVKVGERQVGTNRIEKVLNGCAVLEHWTSASGGKGMSLFYFNPTTDDWKQVWVTGRATGVGGLKEKTMIERFENGGVRFQGEIPLPNGGSYLDRTTLTPMAEGHVRQLIEISRDNGENWEATFDAVYVPMTAGH